MNTYERIALARQLLELGERATLEQIKANFRRLIQQYHPDRNPDQAEHMLEMSRQIIEAYHTLLAYCTNYEFSFTQDEISRYLTKEEWWHEQFGHMM
jgi:hypothetical protein